MSYSGAWYAMPIPFGCHVPDTRSQYWHTSNIEHAVLWARMHLRNLTYAQALAEVRTVGWASHEHLPPECH